MIKVEKVNLNSSDNESQDLDQHKDVSSESEEVLYRLYEIGNLEETNFGVLHRDEKVNIKIVRQFMDTIVTIDDQEYEPEIKSAPATFTHEARKWEITLGIQGNFRRGKYVLEINDERHDELPEAPKKERKKLTRLQSFGSM